MRKLIVVYAFTYILYGCNSLQRMYISFGSAKENSVHLNDGIIRIFFDRHGFIYPDHFVDDKSINESDSRLGNYYQNNKEVYNQICEAYKVNPYSGDLNIVKPKDEPLQESLIESYASKINFNQKGRDLVFIIHGYNENPTIPKNNTSVFENKVTRDSIKKIFPTKHFLFVEIYWDGLSADQGYSLLKAFNSIHIWGYAQVHATFVGLELRRILNKINSPNIYVITHSHGAGIITTALFNVKKFGISNYLNPKKWLYDINQCYSNNVYKTPDQQFYIGMLAPAIPGVNVFNKYYNRTINSTDSIMKNNNYHFVIGFNRNDKVTTKYKIAAKRLGSTSLACIPDELDSTKALFDFDKSIIADEKFDEFNNGKKQKKHSWLVYMQNQPHFTNFLNKLFSP